MNKLIAVRRESTADRLQRLEKSVVWALENSDVASVRRYLRHLIPLRRLRKIGVKEDYVFLGDFVSVLVGPFPDAELAALYFAFACRRGGGSPVYKMMKMTQAERHEFLWSQPDVEYLRPEEDLEFVSPLEEN